MSTSKSGSVMKVRMNLASPMGIEEGEYELVISGWRFACDDKTIQDYKIMAVVRCSGYNPEVEHQRPMPVEYGRDAGGCQPILINFPIAHRNHFKGVNQVVRTMREVWENGGRVCFHCNNGEMRSPVAVCVVLKAATGIDGPHWLHQICQIRKVDNLLRRFDTEYFQCNNPNYIPAYYREFVMCFRLHGFAAPISEFKLWYRSYYRLSLIHI